MSNLNGDSTVAGVTAVVGVNTSPAPGGNGGWFESAEGEGVRGWSKNPNHGGVVGVNTGGGNGGYFESADGEGVRGWSKNPNHGGVVGVNTGGGNGGYFESADGEGVRGWSKNPNHGGVVGVNSAGGDAGFFEGHVNVTGNLTVRGDIFLTGADYAEAMTTTDAAVEPGVVVVVGADGEIHPCERDYDTAVAGIVSGAGGVRPAIVLDRHDNSAHVALMGKVWCAADAEAAPIRPGDLLTTSATTGHCRRVTEPERAFGAVIGKALTPLTSGRGLVRVFVSPR
ncbi:hypothetical protein [Nocardia sp. NPDC050175]|uniref:hypothetical protein n=1 Tax=Nocardia sp. NPDC050175 TaxID=3364317 RepID=UPI0037B75E9D